MGKATVIHKATRRKIARKYAIKNHDKLFARAVTRKMVKKPCEICGEVVTEAHHDNYKKPYAVRWLCKEHHEEVDTELNRIKGD